MTTANTKPARAALAAAVSGVRFCDPSKLTASGRNPETGCRPDSLFGFWAVDPIRFQQMYELVRTVDLTAITAQRMAAGLTIKAAFPSAPLPSERPDVSPSQDQSPDDDDDDEDFDSDAEDGDDPEASKPYAVNSGIAQVALTGPLSKYVTSFQAITGGTSTVAARRAIRMAMADPEVTGLMLYIDSPGGTVDGTSDLASDIAAFAAAKPCMSYIADMGASAAYWCASQADSVYCNATAQVGCIGAVLRLEDTSGKYEKDGVKVHVISTGDYKGMGADGAPITDKQLAEYRRLANSLNDQFVSAVAAGREMPMDKCRALADGRVHVGSEAEQLGLVDAVASYDDAMKALYMEALKMSNPIEAFKAENPSAYKAIYDEGFNAGKAAGFTEGEATERERFAALANCPTFSGRHDFIVAQAIKGHDVARAKGDLAEALAAENATLRAKADEAARAQALAAAAHPQAPGFTGANLPQVGTTAEPGNPKARYESRLGELVKGGMTRAQAVATIAKEDPQLRAAYVEAAQPRK